MSDTTPSFDLLTEPWIPVVDGSGCHSDMSLVDLIGRAAELVDIVAETPLSTSALYRLVLALVRRIYGPETQDEWRDLYDRGRFDESLLTGYASQWRDRFDLFSATHPFYQVADLITVNKNGPTDPASVTKLALEMTSGNNAVLFDHRVDELPTAFSSAKAARALVTTQAWALCGGKGPTTKRFGEHPYASHAPLVGAWYVIVQGVSLFETLMFNLFPSRLEPGDRPAWEASEFRMPGAGVVPLGLLDEMTLPARYCRLLPSPTAIGAWGCATVYLAQGLARAEQPRPCAFHRRDPKRGIVPYGFRVGRSAWRDSGPLFKPDGDEDLRPLAIQALSHRSVRKSVATAASLNLRMFGLANDKGKPLAFREERFAVHPEIMADPDLATYVETALSHIQNIATAVRRALKEAVRWLVFEPSLERRLDRSAERRLVRSAERLLDRSGLWTGMEGHFHELLKGLPDHPEGAFRRCVEACLRVASDAYERGCVFLGGTGAKHEKARAHGQKMLRRGLAATRKTIAPDEEAA